MNTKNQRTAYGQTLLKMGAVDPSIVVLEADLGKSTMSCLFGQAYPDRYFEMGIAEQNMASFAAGLALTGKIAFINSFAVFASGRTYDQIRQSICIGKLNVKVVGSSSGLSDFGDGATHQAVEDFAIMRAIPNMCVLAPVDAFETAQMVKYMIRTEGPFYLRLNRNDMDFILPQQERPYNKDPLVVHEGKDAVVFAHGSMVGKAMQAARQLEKRGIGVRVVNVSMIKPIDVHAITALCIDAKTVICAEEHSVIGGLGDAVAGCLSREGIRITKIGIADQFGQSATSHDELMNVYGLTEQAVADAVLASICRKEEI